MYRLSVSKTKTFESCRKKFHLNYVLKMKPVKDFRFFGYGKFLHAILEDFHKALIENPSLDHSKVMGKIFKYQWTEFQKEPNEKVKLNEEEKKEAYQTIDLYLQILAHENKPANIIGVEKEFKIDISGVATLVGMIDRIQIDEDGITHVIDYKTSKSMKYYEDDTFQLETYAYVLMTEDESLQTVRGSYMFLKHKFEMITKEFSRDQIMKIGPKIVDYAERMQAEKEFPANASFLCSFCGYQPICDEGKAALLPKIIKSGITNWT